MEWKIGLEYEGSPCGSAALRQEGLYVQVECECSPVTEQVVRAYLPAEGEPCCLGVLIPEGGKLHLSRRIAASNLPAPPYEGGFVSPNARLWSPWSGEINEIPVEGAIARREKGVLTVALPWQPGAPFPWLGLAADSTPMTINGKEYLTVTAE